MYKSKLQELCHQQHSWNLPEYTSVKDGQDHNPRFTATVTVNGIPFQTSPDQCHRSSKEAQNQAAKLALDHFTSAKTIQHSPKWGSSASVEASSSSGIPALNTTMDIKSANSGTSHPPKNENVQALQTIEALFGFNDIKTCKGFATLNTKLETGPADSGIQRPAEENVLTVHKNATSLHLQDNTRSKDMLHLYKNRLQMYAQKRNLGLPIYSCEINGPSHAHRFKSRVKIDDKTYETLDSFTTLKEAEHAAARVAFESLSPDETQEDEGLYKSLLQELAQKEGFPIPVYDTAKSGPFHMPTFVSTVDIGGKPFQGQKARTKKEAEMNAAKAAYRSFPERKESNGQTEMKPMVLSSGDEIRRALEISSSQLLSIISDEGEPNRRATEASFLIKEEKPEEDKDTDTSAKRSRCLFSSDTIYARLRDPFPFTASSTQDGAPTPSVMEGGIEAAAEANTLPTQKVLVCPRKPNITCPTGASVLFSDEKWVAVRIDVNHSK